jgi:flagellar basal-body rod protein FlgB
MAIFGKTFNVLEQALDVRYKRFGVLASNIANSETPGYRSRDYDFSGELEKVLGVKDELEKTNPMHMDVSSSSGARIVYDNSHAVGADGNSVDLDKATAKLADNSRGYQNSATWLGVQLKILSQAVKGRGGV